MTTLRCISPVDGSLVAVRETLSAGDVAALCGVMRVAQRGWAERPVQERVSIMRRAVDIMGSQTDRMTHELAWQMGRPVRYGGEFRGFAERANYMCDVAEDALRALVVEETDHVLRQVLREPLGLVLVIAPWNYPYMTAINTIVPALVAGNGVLLKHSEQTLLVGEHLAEVLHAAGVPADVFANVFLDHDAAGSVVAGRNVDYVNFTGSVRGGKAIEMAAAGTFMGVSTELGGKDPAYIRQDAHLDDAVDGVLDGAMFNSGQCCCGIERIYVHESLYDRFVDKAVAWVRKAKLGSPFDPLTTMGPMANTRFARVIREQVAEAIAQGAKAHVDPMPADDGDVYLTPQILTGVTHSMRIMREETFGPVVGIMPVGNDDEAIRLMNDSDFGLTASVWTSDAAAAERIGALLETGTVFMNRCDYLDPALCWTGCKDTGRGISLSKSAYLTLTRPKSYHLRKTV